MCDSKCEFKATDFWHNSLEQYITNMRWFRGWPDFHHSLIQDGQGEGNLSRHSVHLFGSTFLCGSFILQNLHTFGKDGCQQILFYRLIMICDPRKGNRSPSFHIQMLKMILCTWLGFKPISKANHGSQVEWGFWFSTVVLSTPTPREGIGTKHTVIRSLDGPTWNDGRAIL